MNRETFQRYALVTVVVLLAAIAVQGKNIRRHFHANRDGDRCRIVNASVDGPPAPPEPPAPPAPPDAMAPPAPPPPPPPPAFSAADARRIEADARRMAADAERQAHIAMRQAERDARLAAEQAQRAGGHSAPTMMTVAMRDDVLYEQAFSFRSGNRLTVGLSSEDVVVETARGSQATVRVIGRGRDARAEFERRRFSADLSSGTLRVRTNPERRVLSGSTNAGFTVVIALPVEAQMDVATSSGSMRVGRAEGRSATFTTSSGDIELGAIRADRISVTASSGDIQADALDGAVEIATSSGDVEVTRLAGRSASVATSSGSVSVERAESARFTATTSSGDVEAGGLSAVTSVSTGSGEVDLAFTRLAETEVQTGSGSVSLTLPRGAGADVDLSSADIEFGRGLEFQGERGRRNAQGRIGRGGPSVEVSTGSGSISLRG
jgi:Putative adhesin